MPTTGLHHVGMALDTQAARAHHPLPMTSQIKNTLNREAILSLLTDAEVAKVSRAESEPRLIEGDEYIDLADLGSGVQLVQATPRTAPSHALPRSAVSDGTWAKIVKAVATS
jgi:hypothetical protein